MRKYLGILPLALTLTLSGCSWEQVGHNVSAFDKVATMRFFELYKTDIRYSDFDEDTGVRSASRSPRMLPMRIADNDKWMDFTDDLGPKYITFGKRIERATFPDGLEPITEFLAWSELPAAQRLKTLEALNNREEFTSIEARVVQERGTDEPLLVFTMSSLPFTKQPAYALDSDNAYQMLRMATIWHKTPN